MSQSSDDSVKAQVERVYSYLLNYTLTVKGKISLHYLNYIERNHIKITSKSQKQAHFAVLRPSRWEASTTNSLLWLLGVRDQNPTHSNPHCRPGPLIVTPSSSQESRGAQGRAMHWKFPAAPGTSQQSVLFSYWKQAVIRTQPTSCLCISEPGLHRSSTSGATGTDPSWSKFNTAQSASVKLPDTVDLKKRQLLKEKQPKELAMLKTRQEGLQAS